MTFDGLTMVYNKRTFETTLEREVSRSNRYRRALSLVLFDLDHFKKINDERGHLAGDAILRQFAGVVKQNVRREDTVGRVGGEEFALLLPEVAIQPARGVAEKIRALIERFSFRFEEHVIRVTSSFGVATLAEAMTPPELYGAADERLYAAKEAGRNRVM